MGTTYAYNGFNQLTTVSGGFAGTLAYDPAHRLYQLNSGALVTRFQYDGASLVAEYDGANAMLRRYVHGPGSDEPIVWYEGAGTSSRRFLQADERGSVIAVSDSSGVSLAINRYDEYGIPQTGNLGRFSYTGQTALPEIGLMYYKARMYSPSLGWFMQTDPIGYGDGLGWYNYVGGDPVNFVDPSGLFLVCVPAAWYRNDEGVHPSNRQACFNFPDSVASLTGPNANKGSGSGGSGSPQSDDIVVNGKRVRRVASFPNTDGNFSCIFSGGKFVFVHFSNNGAIDRVDANLTSFPAYDNGNAIPQLTMPGSNPFFQSQSSHVLYLSNIELEFSARTPSSNGRYSHILTGRGNAQEVNDVGSSINVNIYTNGGSGSCR